MNANQLLGYPDNARLLIINADDFGMCHAVNEAIFQTLTEGIVASTTVMMPCPWSPHALRLLGEHPEISFGVHLTIICDFGDYRWRPLTSKDAVPSLVDHTGYFPRYDKIPEFLDRARLDEVELEFRAQIDAVLRACLSPTHLDWHCLADGGRRDIFAMTRNLAREYGLALRVHDRQHAQQCLDNGLPVNEFDMLDSYHLDSSDKNARYAELLRELPAGLSEWAVHPSLGDAEAKALEPDAWAVRRADYDFLMSADARRVIDEEEIVVLDYQTLQALWAT